MLFNEEVPTNCSFYRTQRHGDTETQSFLLPHRQKTYSVSPCLYILQLPFIGRTNKPFDRLRYKGRQADR